MTIDPTGDRHLYAPDRRLELRPDPSGQPPVQVLAVRGRGVVATVVPNVVRVDVSEHFNSVTAVSSGFSLVLPLTPGSAARWPSMP